MKTLTQDSLIKALKKLGLHNGDVVLVHSDLRMLGIPENCHTRDEILKFYLEALQVVLGKEGTIAVPAYFYEYARFGISFDVDNSPVSTPLGSFSQWVSTLPNRVRSCNPLQSIAAIGARAYELCGSNSLSGYGTTSPWHRLRLMNGKILFLGAPVQSMTYVHYIEQQYGVPHLYFKTYPYPVTKKGQQLPGNVISAVRYLDYKIEYLIEPFRNALIQQHAMNVEYINESAIHITDAESAFQIGTAHLDKNPYFFLKQPPQFIEGVIPMDGITGPTV